jgi:CRP/FNR family cyclic AMP-dependent transcriptional regulator
LIEKLERQEHTTRDRKGGSVSASSVKINGGELESWHSSIRARLLEVCVELANTTLDMRRQLLARHFLNSTMPTTAVDDLVRFTSVRRIAAAQVILAEGTVGDCLYGILSGRVRIYSTSADGEEILLNVMDKGELFGEVALLDSRPRTASAAALEQTELMCIHRDHLLPYLRQHPDIALGMFSLLCSRIRWTATLLEDGAFLDFPAKLAKRLLFLSERYGCADRQGTRISLQLSQDDLGNMVGATREAINKQLALWRSQGIVQTARKTVIIRDQETLRRISQGVDIG